MARLSRRRSFQEASREEPDSPDGAASAAQLPRAEFPRPREGEAQPLPTTVWMARRGAVTE